MKVKELVAQLQTLDQELDVYGYTESEDLQAPGHIIRMLDIESAEVIEATTIRGDDQVPAIKLGKDDLSRKLAIITVTSDF